jgi:hypothetical protein
LEGVGHKHQDTLQSLLYKNKFVYIVKEYQNKLNTYLRDIETINNQAGHFLDSKIEFKKEWASAVVQYSVPDLDAQLSGLVAEAVDLGRLETQLQQSATATTPTAQPPPVNRHFISRDPAKA